VALAAVDDEKTLAKLTQLYDVHSNIIRSHQRAALVANHKIVCTNS